MKRFISVFALALVIGAFASAGNRAWNEGPLQWSDFQGNPAIKATTSYFKGFLKIETDIDFQSKSKTKLNSEATFATHALALMDCNASYTDTVNQSNQRLRYHQLQFDMLEIVRRRLQADLNSGMVGIEADSRVVYYQRVYEEQIADLAKATINGSNDQKLQQFEYATRKQLDEFMLPAAPEVKPGNWIAGWLVGTGCLIPTGDIAEQLNYAWLFNIGLYGGYKHFILKADISYGQPDIKNFGDYKFNPLGLPLDDGYYHNSTNKYTKQLSGSVSIGYQFIDTKRFALTPHIGGGWTNYAWYGATFQKDKDETTQKDAWKTISDATKESFHNFNFMAGIDFDWRFHSTVSDKSSFLNGRREQYTSSIRLTPYVICYKYKTISPQCKGVQVGITLTYSGFIRALRLE